jgi:hypothetical protein
VEHRIVADFMAQQSADNSVSVTDLQSVAVLRATLDRLVQGDLEAMLSGT